MSLFRSNLTCSSHLISYHRRYREGWCTTTLLVLRALTLSERGRHCRTCKVPRRTRRWLAGRSWFVWGAGASAGGAARHAAAATSPHGAWPASPHGTAVRTALHSRPHPHTTRDAGSATVGRVRLARTDLTQPLTPTYGSQCGNQEFIF